MRYAPDDIRLGEDADGFAVGIAHDDELDMRLCRDRRRIDEQRFSLDRYQPFASLIQQLLNEHVNAP